jgi:predicted hydrocarbon binding protein
MAEFQSYAPDSVEVLGEVIESFVLAFPQEIRSFGLQTLERHGISEIKPDQYYHAQSFLGAMKEIADNTGRNMMTRIGERIALRVQMPDGFDSLQSALEGLDKAYHSKYRGGPIGHWTYTHHGQIDNLTKGVMVSGNHYCCAFDRGVLEGFAKRFRPGNITDALVRHDDASPCRKHGADTCSYIITWG